MRIKDIIRENVDMSWQVGIDELFNPEALEQAQHQEKRQAMLKKMSKGTPVFRKPVRQAEKSFSNIPPQDQPKSAGYLGNVNVAVRTKHISKSDGEKLTDIS